MKTEEVRIQVPLSPEAASKVATLKQALKRPRARVLQALVLAGLEAVGDDPELLERNIRK